MYASTQDSQSVIGLEFTIAQEVNVDTADAKLSLYMVQSLSGLKFGSSWVNFTCKFWTSRMSFSDLKHRQQNKLGSKCMISIKFYLLCIGEKNNNIKIN